MNRFLTVSAVLAALAATPAAAAPVELTVFYAWPSHQRFHEPIAAAFMERHPEIKIRFQAPASSYDEAFQSLLRQGMTGSLPDVTFAGYQMLRALADRGLAQDLGPLIAATPDWGGRGFTDPVLALGRAAGRQVALPFVMSTPIVYVNGELVARAGGDDAPFPADWDGLIGLAHRVDGLGPDIDGMYYGLGVDDWTTQALILNQGGSLLTPDETDIAFDGPEGLAALRLFRRFREEGGQPAIGDESARQQFVAGKLGILVASTSGVRGLETDIGGRFPLKTARLPLADRGRGRLPTGGMAGVILTDDPDKRAAAWAYLQFASGPEAQTLMVQKSGYTPVTSLALGPDHLGDFYREHPNWSTSIEQIPVSVPWTAWPGPNGVEIAQALLDAMAALAQDRLSPDEALARMASDARRLISRR
ncbi:ABC transporter substrate-binding protein [Inquilinus sp. Marseille-Q2685]|uniref:ABC transporter substrate-binding protein n=1 Tax=Inquilinus sp. Marseille-Q2685 TaxID=2866581 RepID=UPI001CE4964D|nr:ABC transporter substrate-binding protein [Inquilinus sp. Marseille-Q2685]